VYSPLASLRTIVDAHPADSHLVSTGAHSTYIEHMTRDARASGRKLTAAEGVLALWQPGCMGPAGYPAEAHWYISETVIKLHRSTVKPQLAR
jgi:hypothetical protein